jgi:hypothetical protein
MRHRERRSQALGAPFLPERARRRVVQDPHLPGSASNEDPGHLSNLRPGLPFPSSEGESPGGVSETTSETRLSEVDAFVDHPAARCTRTARRRRRLPRR